MRRTILLVAIGCVIVVFGMRQFVGGFSASHAGNIDFANASTAERAQWMQNVAHAEERRLIRAARESVADARLSRIGERAEAALSRMTIVLRYETPVSLAEPVERYQRRFQAAYCPRFLKTPSSEHRLTYIVSHQAPDRSRLVDVEINNRTCAGKG